MIKSACVITCDIKESRKLKDRRVIQEKLKKTVRAVNTGYKGDILANFIITRGDEFQGVLKDKKSCYDVLLFIRESLPVDFYCGVGIGSINTEISNKPTEMDGTSFHRSREALQEAKRLNSWIIVQSGDNLFDETLNVMISLVDTIKRGWTKRQREIISYYKGKELTYSELGKRINVTKQSISKILKAADLEMVERAEEVIGEYLSKPIMVDK